MIYGFKCQENKDYVNGVLPQTIIMNYELQLYFDDECLNNVDTHKLLGAHLDKSLN